MLQDLYSHVEQLRSEDIAVLAQRMVTVSLELTTVSYLSDTTLKHTWHGMPHRALYSRVALAAGSCLTVLINDDFVIQHTQSYR